MVFVANKQYRVALICGLSILEILENLYGRIKTVVNNNSEFTIKDFPYTKEQIRNIYKLAIKNIQQIKTQEKYNQSIIEAVYDIAEKIQKLSECINRLEHKLNHVLTLERGLEVTWLFIVKLSKSVLVRIFCLLFVVLFIYYLFNSWFDLFSSKPTTKFYSSVWDDRIYCSGWENYQEKYRNRCSNSKESSIIVPIDYPDSDKVFTLFIDGVFISSSNAAIREQNILAYLGSTLIGKYTICSPQKLFFKIPKALISTNNVKIDLHFPNAQSPKLLNICGDLGISAIWIKDFSVEDTVPDYNLGTTIYAFRK